MRRMTFVPAALLVIAAALVSNASAQGAKKDWVPDSTIEIIAPASPGGGWDLTARAVQRTMTESKLVTKNIIVSADGNARPPPIISREPQRPNASLPPAAFSSTESFSKGLFCSVALTATREAKIQARQMAGFVFAATDWLTIKAAGMVGIFLIRSSITGG